MSLSDKLQTLRKQAGLSQEQLATQLYVSRQAISKWENGESIPEVENVIQLSKLFGVSTDYLLLDEVSTAAPGNSSAESRVPVHVIGTAIIAMGFIVVLSAYFSYQNLLIVSLGFLIQIAGVSLYELLRYRHNLPAQPLFYCFNIWLLVPFPIMFLLDSIMNPDTIFYVLTKILHLNLPGHPFLVPVLLYLLISVPITAILLHIHYKRR